MTLAFELTALVALADPAAVFEDARRWSTFVGVVSDGMAYEVVTAIRDDGVYGEDFFSRADKRRGLERAADRTSTDRHVFVGRTAEDERLAGETGGEYLPLTEAAEKAGWATTPTQ